MTHSATSSGWSIFFWPRRGRLGALFEQGRVDVAGEDGAGADAVAAFLGVDRLGQPALAELPGDVRRAGLGVGGRPASETMFTIVPSPCLRMPGRTAGAVRKCR